MIPYLTDFLFMFFKHVSPESSFLKEVEIGRRKTESLPVYETKSSLLFLIFMHTGLI